MNEKYPGSLLKFPFNLVYLSLIEYEKESHDETVDCV